MRLLKTQSDGNFSLVEIQGNEPPPYAILSHTWGANGDEVTYQDLIDGVEKEKVGYNKIAFCEGQAMKDHLDYFWIDTCCIDKSSSAELSEAINSMFNWYRKASKCYVYLSDVSSTDSAQDCTTFSKSRWFTRGWTLQELLAPQCVEFFSKEGDLMGDKHSRAEEISMITNIPIEALQEPDLFRFSVGERMRWAERRDTTRKEDRVYSLLGIFNIYLPPIYGEGEDHARQRMERLLRESETSKEAKLSKIQHWLSAPDPSINYQMALKRRHHDTGLWFLHGERYASWKTDAASFLWLHGIPGCGKTILSSTIVENMSQYCKNHSGHAAAYFYFDFNDVQKQDSERMLRSLLVQLARHAVDIPSSFVSLFASHDDGKRPPALRELLKTLHSMIQEFEEVYIILDALDECGQRLELTEMLGTIASWKLPNLHLLMTSRQEKDIESCLEGFVDAQNSICLQSDVVDQDIQRYIRQRLSDDKNLIKWRKDGALRQEIEDTLMTGSKGMFRWAVCQLDTLGNCLSRSLLRKALKALPSTLDKTYERILNNINNEYADYAIRILQWLAFSERPLSIDEIAEVVAIDVSRDPQFDREEVLEDPFDALKICSSLVTITTSSSEWKPEHQIVLSHYSVKEFLLSDRIQRGPAARYGLQAIACHNALAIASLNYLNTLQEPKIMTGGGLHAFKLARYSAMFWHRHARKAGNQTAEVDRLALRLLSTDNPAYLNWIRISDPDRQLHGSESTSDYIPVRRFRYESRTGKFEMLPTTKDMLRPLYYASLLGLKNVASMLLACGADVNASGGTRNNALYAAIERGHEDTARVLLEAGANVGPDGQRKGALHHALASSTCTSSLVGMLIEFGAAKDTVDALHMTPLHYCVKYKHSVIATQLINAHVPIDIRIHRSGTPIKSRRKAVLNDTIPPAPEGVETGLTPLHYAAVTGNAVMAKLLLGHGADPGALSDYLETPLHVAFGNQLSGPKYSDAWNVPYLEWEMSFRFNLSEKKDRETLVSEFFDLLIEVQKTLLGDPRTCPNAKDYKGRSPLHCVLYGSSKSAAQVQQLVLHGADPACRDLRQQTPLHLASRAGDDVSVRVLISLGAKVGQEDDCGLNALHHAAHKGSHTTIVSILDAQEAKATRLAASKDKTGRNALHHLFHGGAEVYIWTVRLLLNAGADSSAVDDSGNTPLAILARRTPYASDYDIWRHLLSIEGNASYSNRKGQNLGHLCSLGPELHLRILSLLTVCGVDLSKKDHEGKTVLHTAAIRGSLTTHVKDYLVHVVGLDAAERDVHGRTVSEYASNSALQRPHESVLEGSESDDESMFDFVDDEDTDDEEDEAPGKTAKRKRSSSESEADDLHRYRDVVRRCLDSPVHSAGS